MTESAGRASTEGAPSAGSGSDLAAGILPLAPRTHHLLMLEFGNRKRLRRSASGVAPALF